MQLNSQEGKEVPQHTYGDQGGQYIQLLLIHDLGTRWREWSASRLGRALPPVSIVQETGWASRLVWTQTRGKILITSNIKSGYLAVVSLTPEDSETEAVTEHSFSCTSNIMF
jgi:hypothetical protein